MPRRERPSVIRRSEHWRCVAVEDHQGDLNRLIAAAFGWKSRNIEWRSPIREDGYAEYYDQAFLDLLGVGDFKMPLDEFWPRSGPRCDGLARTDDGKLILVEAKAYIDECVDYLSRASAKSLQKIAQRLEEAKKAFHASEDANWHTPFYQMANRLAHFYYLAEISGKDAYLAFLHFANAPDVEKPVSREAWEKANRLARKCLGLTDCRLLRRVADLIVDLEEI